MKSLTKKIKGDNKEIVEKLVNNRIISLGYMTKEDIQKEKKEVLSNFPIYEKFYREIKKIPNYIKGFFQI